MCYPEVALTREPEYSDYMKRIAFGTVAPAQNRHNPAYSIWSLGNGLRHMIVDSNKKPVSGHSYTTLAAAQAALNALMGGSGGAAAVASAAYTPVSTRVVATAPAPARAAPAVYTPPAPAPVPARYAPAPVVEEAFEEEEEDDDEEPAPPPAPVQRASEQRGASGFTAREEQDMVAAMSRDIDASGEEQLIIPPGWTKVKVSSRMWNFDPNDPHGALYAIKKDKLKLQIGWFDGTWQANCNAEIFWTIPVKTVTEALWRGTDQIEKWDVMGKLEKIKRESYGYGY